MEQGQRTRPHLTFPPLLQCPLSPPLLCLTNWSQCQALDCTFALLLRKHLQYLHTPHCTYFCYLHTPPVCTFPTCVHTSDICTPSVCMFLSPTPSPDHQSPVRQFLHFVLGGVFLLWQICDIILQSSKCCIYLSYVCVYLMFTLLLRILHHTV